MVVFKSLFKIEKGSDLLLSSTGDFDSETLLNMKFLKLLSLALNSLSGLFSSVLLVSHGFLDGFINKNFINYIKKKNTKNSFKNFKFIMFK